MTRIFLALSLLTLFSLTACNKETPCPAKFRDLKADGDDATCACTKEMNKGSVWGDGIYTTDSSPCKAAIHAGAISSEGTIKMKKALGCAAYTGSETNGVRTGKWGKYGSSFWFPGHGDGKCKAPPKFNNGDPCPSAFNKLGTDNATCKCSSFTGSVYGTAVYTTDSSICKAALHAGAVTKNGGEVSVKATNGCKAYQSTDANGVKTSKWGSYKSSFYFPSKGDGKCVN